MPLMQGTFPREEAFWKSLPLSKYYKTEHIDHAAQLLSVIANADYTNPIPMKQHLTTPISLTPLRTGSSVAFFNGYNWCLGTFQTISAGAYVVLHVDKRVRCDDVTDLDEPDSDVDDAEPVFRIRGSHLRILCESVTYDKHEHVMALFPGGSTFYPASVQRRCHRDWLVIFDHENPDREGEHELVGRLIQPKCIFKT